MAKPRHPHRRPVRYALRCTKCALTWETREQLRATVGDIQREHFMRMHDTAELTFELVDTWTDRVVKVLH